MKTLFVEKTKILMMTLLTSTLLVSCGGGDDVSPEEAAYNEAVQLPQCPKDIQSTIHETGIKIKRGFEAIENLNNMILNVQELYENNQLQYSDIVKTISVIDDAIIVVQNAIAKGNWYISNYGSMTKCKLKVDSDYDYDTNTKTNTVHYYNLSDEVKGIKNTTSTLIENKKILEQAKENFTILINLLDSGEELQNSESVADEILEYTDNHEILDEVESIFSDDELMINTAEQYV